MSGGSLSNAKLSDGDARKFAASIVMKNFRHADFRANLDEVGHRSGEPIKVFLESDTLGMIAGRLIDEGVTDGATLAVYFPDRLDISLCRLGAPDIGEVTPVDKSAHEHSTIGMVIDAIRNSDSTAMDLVFLWTHSTVRVVA